MNLTDSRLAQAGNEKLELAMLSFFEQFRKIYIGDQVQKSSKVTYSLLASFLTSRVWSCMEGKTVDHSYNKPPDFQYWNNPNVFSKSVEF